MGTNKPAEGLTTHGSGLACFGVLFAFQRPFRQLPGVEYQVGDIPKPPVAS